MRIPTDQRLHSLVFNHVRTLKILRLVDAICRRSSNELHHYPREWVCLRRRYIGYIHSNHWRNKCSHRMAPTLKILYRSIWIGFSLKKKQPLRDIINFASSTTLCRSSQLLWPKDEKVRSRIINSWSVANIDLVDLPSRRRYLDHKFSGSTSMDELGSFVVIIPRSNPSVFQDKQKFW